MEERVIWLVMCEVCVDHRLWPRSWIWYFGMDGRPLNLHQLRMPRRRMRRKSRLLRENLVLKGPFSKDSNVGWKKISEKPVVRIWV